MILKRMIGKSIFRAKLGISIRDIDCCWVVTLLVWDLTANGYIDEQSFLTALVIALSLLSIVLFGNFIGAMLPFILSRLGFDPAVSSAPFVATVVDVSGIIIYFSIAIIFLKILL